MDLMNHSATGKARFSKGMRIGFSLAFLFSFLFLLAGFIPVFPNLPAPTQISDDIFSGSTGDIVVWLSPSEESDSLTCNSSRREGSKPERTA
jgi:hypothetical protein